MDGKVLELGRPIITMVQSTQSIMGKHATRVYAASSAPRRSLPQPKMRAVFVMVGNVLAEQPLQVAFIDRNNVIQQVTAAAADPTLSDSILPGAFERSPNRTHLQGSNGRWDFQSVLYIPIEDEKLRS